MTIEEIKDKKKNLGLSTGQIIQDLGFDAGDWHNFMRGDKPFPNSRLKALYWYFKYKEVEQAINTSS